MKLPRLPYDASAFSVTENHKDFIVLFSRKGNRKILNENQLVETFSAAFPEYRTIILRLEEHSITTIIRILTYDSLIYFHKPPHILCNLSHLIFTYILSDI